MIDRSRAGARAIACCVAIGVAIGVALVASGQPAPDPASKARGAGVLAVRVDRIRVVGATAFDERELASTLQPYVGRALTTTDLMALTRAVTRRYVDAGYVTSRARLPDQDFVDGLLVVEVVEGGLGRIHVEGHRRMRAAFVERRLRRIARGPLDARRLAIELERLQRRDWIERVDAVLEPGASPSLHDLRLRVVETDAADLTLFASNDQPDSVGAYGGGLSGAWANIVGWGDRLSFGARFTEGIRQIDLAVTAPITSADSELRIAWSHAENDVVEPVLSELEIASEFDRLELELRHPVLRAGDFESWTGLVADWTRARSSLSGDAFCFRADVVDCRPTVTAIRWRQDVSWRDRRSAVALRSTLGFGISGLGATRERDRADADSEFVSWLLQLRGQRRLGDALGSVLALRSDLQLASEPLLSSERIVLGGAHSVRGYRRGQLVRDNAIVAALEWHVPVWRRAFGEPILTLSPFVDFGHGWNDRGRSRIETISSVGLALRLEPGFGLDAKLSWGHRLRTGLDGADGLQGEGIYFEVAWHVF